MRPSNLQLIIASMLGAALFYIGSASAGAIKTWASGETLTSSDLNAAFQHIHSLMVGGHGGRLVDADVSSSANIASSKIKGGSGLPKAYGRSATTCGAGTCPLSSSYNISSIVWAALGQYTVTFTNQLTDSNYIAIANGEENTYWCRGVPGSTTTMTVYCNETDGTPGAINGKFGVIVIDDN